MDEPLFQVVKGSPTEEELAALVAVLTLRGGRRGGGTGSPGVRVVGVLALGPRPGPAGPGSLADVGPAPVT